MVELNIKTPKWALPLLKPSRYKGAKGGRGCVHPDTLIDTPAGQVPIKDFEGGDVFAYHDGSVIIAESSKPKRYTVEQLYEVKFVDGRKIIVTDEHKFLTVRGWIQLQHLSTFDACLCESCEDFSVHTNKIASISKHSRQYYWDLHIPIYNNYLSNGIINHNSGKSHFFAELVVEACVIDPDTSVVCIRETQKSLVFSAKKLIENKIHSMGVSYLFEILKTEIRCLNGTGIIIFQGMADHTADSIKSLEDFMIAWVEEAQTLSLRSIKLLRPTIRSEKIVDGVLLKSEIWFSWNPDQPEDAVDAFFKNPPDDSVVVHVNYDENPFFPQTLYDEMASDLKRDPDGFAHVWLGEYNTRSDAQIFSGKWRVDEFTPQDDWERPYFGADWGFSQDPTTLTKSWVHDNKLYIEYEAWGIGVEIEDTPKFFDKIPDSRKYVIRADNSRPETISHVKRRGFQIKAANKWTGCVEDGITFIRSFDEIIIHTRCKRMQHEARTYSYKICNRTGDVLPDIVKKNDHLWDSIRYALDPLIKRKEYRIRAL